MIIKPVITITFLWNVVNFVIIVGFVICSGKCDEVMQHIMDVLGIKVPTYVRSRDLIFQMSTTLHPDELKTTTRPCLVPPLEEEEVGDGCVSDDAMSDEEMADGSPLVAPPTLSPSHQYGATEIMAGIKCFDSVSEEHCEDVVNLSGDESNSATDLSLCQPRDSSSLRLGNVIRDRGKDECSELAGKCDTDNHQMQQSCEAKTDEFSVGLCEGEQLLRRTLCQKDVLVYNNSPTSSRGISCTCSGNSLCINNVKERDQDNNATLLRTDKCISCSVVDSSQKLLNNSCNCDTTCKHNSSLIVHRKKDSISSSSFSETVSVNNVNPNDSHNSLNVRTCNEDSVQSVKCLLDSGNECDEYCVRCKVRLLCNSAMDDFSYLCKCELVLRKLFSSGASHKLLNCLECGSLLRFFLKGTCSRRPSDGNISTLADDDCCSISHLLCHCLDEEELAEETLSSVAPAVVSSLIPSEEATHNDGLDDKRKHSLHEQQAKIEKLLGLNQPKPELKEEIKDEMKLEDGTSSITIDTKTEPFKIEKEEEDLGKLREDEELTLNMNIRDLKSEKKFVNSRQQLSKKDTDNTLSNQTALLPESSSNRWNMNTKERREIVEICLDDTDSNSLPDDKTATDMAAPMLPQHFYGTGLCIRSNFDSCNESSSQDELSEIESVECDDSKGTDGVQSDVEDKIVEDLIDDENNGCDPPTSSMEDGIKNTGENTSAYSENLRNIEEMMKLSDRDDRIDVNEEMLGNSSRIGHSNGLRINGQLHTEYDEIIGQSLNQSGLNGINHSVLKTIVGNDENSKQISGLPLAAKFLQNNLNKLNNKLPYHEDAESDELKSIWFNSFCGPRTKEHAEEPLLLSPKSQLASVFLAQVKDLATRKKLLQSVSKSRVDDNIKKLWFWGFDDAMIKHRAVSGSNGFVGVPSPSDKLLTDLTSERIQESHISDDEECDPDSREMNNEEDDSNETNCLNEKSPPRRITRSRTKSSHCSKAQKDIGERDEDEEEEEAVCCCGGLNPALCEATSRFVRRLDPDEDMLRARAVIARRRNINYKRYEPVFAVKLKSLVVENGKRKSKMFKKEVKMRKVEWDEDDQIVTEDKVGDAKEGSEEEVEKVLKKVTPGWYGKGYKKIIRKKTPKSYSLK